MTAAAVRWGRRLAAVLVAASVGVPAAAADAAPTRADSAADSAADSRADGPHAGAWWYRSLRLGEAHRQATGKGVTVAVVDSGINLDAPELRGADIRLMRSPCLNGRTSRSSTGVDALHGTRVVSMIVGNGNGSAGPGSGVMGVAPDATILFWDNTDESFFDEDDRDSSDVTCSPGTVSSLAGRATRMADVVNMSFASAESIFTRKILPGVVRSDEGVLVAAAQATDTGLDKEHGYEMPSSFPGVVSVAAYDRDLEPWSKSDSKLASEQEQEEWHDGVPVFFPVVSAPGVDVPGPGTADVTFETAPATGTSFSSPLVAGTLALVQEKYPDATPNQLIQHLIHYTGSPELDWYEDYGFGNVFPRRLLAHDPTLWPDENPLLQGPRAAVERYPRGIDTEDPPPGAEPSEDEPSGASGAGAQPESAGRAAKQSDGGGPPVWTWPVGGLLLVGAGAAAWFGRRRAGQHDGI